MIVLHSDMGAAMGSSCCSEDHTDCTVIEKSVTGGPCCTADRTDCTIEKPVKAVEETDSPQTELKDELVDSSRRTDSPQAELKEELGGPSRRAIKASDISSDSVTVDFEIHLVKSHPVEPWGITFTYEHGEDVLVVKQAHGKTINDWHATNPNRTARIGDQVISVNGLKSTPEDLLNAIQRQRDIELVMRRRLRIALKFKKQGSLGLRLDRDSYEVLELLEGQIKKDWNSRTKLNEWIVPGDKLAELNGMDTDLLEVLSKLNEGEEITMTFTRPDVSQND